MCDTTATPAILLRAGLLHFHTSTYTLTFSLYPCSHDGSYVVWYIPLWFTYPLALRIFLSDNSGDLSITRSFVCFLF